MNKQQITYWLSWTAMVCYALFLSFPAKSTRWEPKNILVLHSYESSYQWTYEFQKGIDAVVKSSKTPIKLSIEYLDTKRIYSQEYLDEAQKYLHVKYRHYPFDAVIITDDNALKFTKGLSSLFKPDTPMVAVCINDKSATLDDMTKYNKIIYESEAIIENFHLIKSLRPKLKKIYYLSDQSHTSQLIRKKVDEVLATDLLKGIEFIDINSITLAEAEKVLFQISPDDAVLLSHFNTETNQGVYHTYQEISYRLAQASAAPIFVLWEFYIRDGIVGGHVNRSEQLGKDILMALNQFVSLDLASAVDMQISSTRAVFDYQAMQRHQIDMKALPQDVLVLNRPLSYFEQHWKVLLAASFIILCLLVVIVMQGVTLRQKRELGVKNRKIVVLQERTLAVQREMIHLLGEAIETRSGETGNHVKRVARLSALLARLCGLTQREVEMIEIISPMHDVGKIAIPESILDKPGKLTPDEWEIMQTHTTAGYNILNTSEGDITKLAAIVAHEHHERWDGKGYPNQKKGTDIHIFARITAIADVFDALLSERCYKEAWPLENVVSLFERECGFQFDPTLVNLLLNHLDDFIQIRNLYPDTTSYYRAG
ncbi:phosphodiesterase [Vibrio sp. V17_P4S1T151]|nr:MULTISPECIES: HD domain-containing phosphohydrolase [unclassified Vibrio]OXX44371.1 phosphodiesterase [Vibrio sp. V17_P4S1T151]OXX61050.1 phosphodiesterase [Vibrio sp. V15_P4S5T153]